MVDCIASNCYIDAIMVESRPPFTKTLGQSMIRLFFQPSSRRVPVDFRRALREATRILVFCPTEQATVTYADQIESITRLFSGYEIVLLHTEVTGYNPDNYKIQSLFDSLVTVSDIPKGGFLKTARSEEVSQLISKPFDVYIDLDPTLNLLSLYLCRRIYPSIRIGLFKPYGTYFYNLIYNGDEHTPYKDRLDGLCKFLHNLI